ncbi:peptidoglycan DD-metalloendopeptidase family protein [Actinoplanes sp. NPDC049265]|uniref:murein hydrolase activator EnvC family protein n=1 Tax=Actinoplanes sp. NPDC049265 TaxID=3363902 RepID=UPI00371D0337
MLARMPTVLLLLAMLLGPASPFPRSPSPGPISFYRVVPRAPAPFPGPATPGPASSRGVVPRALAHSRGPASLGPTYFNGAVPRAPDPFRGAAPRAPDPFRGAVSRGPALIISPVSPGLVVRAFDPPQRPWLAGHRGVDLSATAGAQIRSPRAGTVLFARVVAGRGVLTVSHPGGLRTTYEPVTASVSVGEAVGAGDVLATVDAGHPGCPVSACLHWGLRRGDTYLDPMVLLGRGRVRLLPL